MSAKLIQLITTKQAANLYKTKRAWIGVYQEVKLVNGVSFYPVVNRDGDSFYLSLIFLDKGKRKRVDVKPGKWISERSIKTGVRFLPMAISFSNDGEAEAVFFEAASISDQIELFKLKG